MHDIYPRNCRHTKIVNTYCKFQDCVLILHYMIQNAVATSSDLFTFTLFEIKIK